MRLSFSARFNHSFSIVSKDVSNKVRDAFVFCVLRSFCVGFLIGRFFCAEISEIPCVFLVLISPFPAENLKNMIYYIDNQLFVKIKYYHI